MLSTDEPEAWERELMADEVWREEHPSCENCLVKTCARAEIHGCGAVRSIKVGVDELPYCDECANEALQGWRIDIIADAIMLLPGVTREQAMERARNIENQLQFARRP